MFKILNLLPFQTAQSEIRFIGILSLNTALFYSQNRLHVSANDSSHRQVDHKNIKTKYLQLHWWLEASNLTNWVLYSVHVVQNTQLQE